MRVSPHEFDLSVAYVVRALIIGLLAWIGFTVVSLDRSVAVIEMRLTTIEHRLP